MAAESAGLLLYRQNAGRIQVFLAHPGGPYWARRDAGAWTIPKGLVEAGEEALVAATREFEEETGIRPHGPYLPLGSVRLRSGKIIHAWAWEGDADASSICSNVVETEWPRGSGRRVRFPEVDRCGWFELEEARRLLNPAQAELLDRLAGAQAHE